MKKKYLKPIAEKEQFFIDEDLLDVAGDLFLSDLEEIPETPLPDDY